MTDKTALRQLIEAVEGGRDDFGLLESVDIADPLKREMRKAYHGSLDAAMALHEALLLGWGWEVNRLSAVVQSASGDRFFGQRFSDVTSRLWLIAILKAYEAQQ